MRRITDTIQEAESTWTDTNSNLCDLRDRYRRAVDLWEKYREASDVIRHWADEQMNGIGCVKPLDVSDIEVYVKWQITHVFSRFHALFLFWCIDNIKNKHCIN